MKKIIQIFLIAVSLSAFGQTKVEKEKTDAKNKYGVQKHWKCEILKDTMTVKIVVYYPSNIACGVFKDQAIAICIDNKGDSLRIIEQCASPKKKFEFGQRVLFKPWKKVERIEHPCDKPMSFSEDIANYKYNSVRRTTFGDFK